MACGTGQSWRARLGQQDDDGGDDGSGRDECVMWSGQQESSTQNKNSRHITATPLHRHTALYLPPTAMLPWVFAMPMIAQVKHLLGGTTSCSIMAGQTTNVAVASLAMISPRRSQA